MEAMTRLTTLPITICLLSLAVPAAAQVNSPACKVPVDALTKVITADHATSADMNGKTTRTITASGVNYVEVGGRWTRSAMGAEDSLKQVQENFRNATAYTCKQLADEAVGGEAAGVYSVHEENQITKADSKVWISKKTGLPLKTEEDLAGVGHIVVAYSYTGIKAPVVK
jgi:hypothetical protein